MDSEGSILSMGCCLSAVRLTDKVNLRLCAVDKLLYICRSAAVVPGCKERLTVIHWLNGETVRGGCTVKEM